MAWAWTQGRANVPGDAVEHVADCELPACGAERQLFFIVQHNFSVGQVGPDDACFGRVDRHGFVAQVETQVVGHRPAITRLSTTAAGKNRYRIVLGITGIPKQTSSGSIAGRDVRA